MNILVAPNDYYVFPTLVMLKSLVENTILRNNDCWNVYIFDEELAEYKMENIHYFCKKNSINIHDIKIQKGIFDKAPTSNHITKATYYRLLAPFLLPIDIDRILYLDGDIITIRSLNSLYETKLESYEAMAVCEGLGVSHVKYEVYDYLNIPHSFPYFNAGVLLMDLNKMRDVLKSTQTIFNFIDKHPILKYHDQDILNGLFYEKVKYVDWRIYNQSIIHIHSKEDARKCLETAAIIHYAGSDKPWKYNYTSWYLLLFWQYARKVNFGCSSFVIFVIQRIKWYIKRYIKL